MLHLYTLCYRQGVARPKGTSSLVRGRVNATHRYVPTKMILVVFYTHMISNPVQSLYKKRTPSAMKSHHRHLLALNQHPIRLARCQRRGELAGVRCTGGGRHRLVAGCCALELLANLLDTGGAGSTVDGGSVAKVGVDTDEELSAGGLDILDNNVALGALLAVSARAVELAKVGDLEAVDGDGTRTVMLDNLVVGTSGTSTTDSGITIFLQSESIWSMVSTCRARNRVWYLPSQTAAHQTFLRVQEPWQWMPSI